MRATCHAPRMPQPRELTRLRAPAMGRATVMATLVALLVAAAAVAVLADARSSGVTFWGTSFVVMGSIAVSGVAATALALLVHARDAVVGRWALFAAGSVLLYLAAAAGMALVVVRWGNYGPTGQWLVVLAGAGHIFPLILLQGLFVISSARIASRSAAVSLLSVLLAIGFFNYLLATATTVEVEAPFDRVRAPLVGVDPLAALAASPAFAAAWIGWLLTVLVGPVVAWRAVGRSTGAARRRLSVIAAASLLPVSVVGS